MDIEQIWEDLKKEIESNTPEELSNNYQIILKLIDHYEENGWYFRYLKHKMDQLAKAA